VGLSKGKEKTARRKY